MGKESQGNLPFNEEEAVQEPGKESEEETIFAYVMVDTATGEETIVATGRFTDYNHAEISFEKRQGFKGGHIRVLSDLSIATQERWEKSHPTKGRFPLNMSVEQAAESKKRGKDIARRDRRYDL